MAKHSAKPRTKKNHSKLLSDTLEKDMREFYVKRKKLGLSHAAIQRQLHRRFGRAIVRELNSNETTQQRVSQHLMTRRLQPYHPWLRPFIRLYIIITSSFKSSRHA